MKRREKTEHNIAMLRYQINDTNCLFFVPFV